MIFLNITPAVHLLFSTVSLWHNYMVSKHISFLNITQHSILCGPDKVSNYALFFKNSSNLISLSSYSTLSESKAASTIPCNVNDLSVVEQLCGIHLAHQITVQMNLTKILVLIYLLVILVLLY